MRGEKQKARLPRLTGRAPDFFLCRNGGVQLGCHPERLHHCPVRLRSDRPDLCQTARHEAETA